jgi:hypothetical protein
MESSLIPLVAAVLAAVPGIFSLWWQIASRRTRLKIIPRGHLATLDRAFPDDGKEGVPCIEVVNLSDYPVTIVAAGIALAGHQYLPARAQGGGGTPYRPHRLDPRESEVFYLETIEIKADTLRKARRAMVRAACGKRFAVGCRRFIRGLADGIATKKR